MISEPRISLRHRLASLCRNYGLESLYVFGSGAAEIHSLMEGGASGGSKASDVDLAFRPQTDRVVSVRGKAELAADLEDLLDAAKVDLISLPETDPFLAINVIRGERLFCEDAYSADEYELYILRRTGDLAPYERERINRILLSPEQNLITTGKVNRWIVASRLEWVERKIADIRLLSLDSYEEFTSDQLNIGSAESSLRRALEALLDLGRHVLAKVFGKVVTEYKQVADELGSAQVLSADLSRKLRVLAGYRDIMVHFYHDAGDRKLFTICLQALGDVLEVRDGMRDWLSKHPELIDAGL